MSAIIIAGIFAAILSLNIYYWCFRSTRKPELYKYMVLANNGTIYMLFLHFGGLKVSLLVMPLLIYNYITTIRNSGICKECKAFLNKSWRQREFVCKECGQE